MTIMESARDYVRQNPRPKDRDDNLEELHDWEDEFFHLISLEQPNAFEVMEHAEISDLLTVTVDKVHEVLAGADSDHASYATEARWVYGTHCLKLAANETPEVPA